MGKPYWMNDDQYDSVSGGDTADPHAGCERKVAAVQAQRDELMRAVRSALVSLSQSATYDVPPIVVRDVADMLQRVNQELNLP